MKRYRQVWRMLIKKADSFPNGQVPDIVSVWSVIILHRWLPTHFLKGIGVEYGETLYDAFIGSYG